jgi:hypothetical protein
MTLNNVKRTYEENPEVLSLNGKKELHSRDKDEKSPRRV